jgi:hypothetical protein
MSWRQGDSDGRKEDEGVGGRWKMKGDSGGRGRKRKELEEGWKMKGDIRGGKKDEGVGGRVEDERRL